MWSPKTNANGVRNQFYENMRQVTPGDIVFSFCDTRIKAVGIVTGAAQTAPKPDFGNAGLNWSNEGWFVPVYYCAFEAPIRPTRSWSPRCCTTPSKTRRRRSMNSRACAGKPLPD